MIDACRSNVLPFSGERRTDARSYHGRAARPTRERAARAFIRCNGLFDSSREGSGYGVIPRRLGQDDGSASYDVVFSTDWTWSTFTSS